MSNMSADDPDVMIVSLRASRSIRRKVLGKCEVVKFTSNQEAPVILHKF